MTQPARADALHDDGQAARASSTIDFYERNAARYAETTRSLNLSDEIALFINELPRGARVLDVGCGGGRDLLAFGRAGVCATGLELSAELATLARVHSGCEVVVGDLRKPPFPPQTFDGLWAAASLLHLERDEILPALSELRRLLPAAGIFFASMKMGIGAEHAADGRLFTYFMPEDWSRLLQATGFADSRIRTQVVESADGSPASAWIQSLSRAG